jgi:hypothetical protein
MIEAYPLCWPEGWKRTNPYARESSKFKSTFATARDDLLREVERLIQSRYYLHAPDPVLSTNVTLRQDGLPYANQREPDDPGVAIYFQYKKKPMVFACDKYVKVWENMVAIRKTIEAIRGMERWGASDMMERAFTGFVAIADSSWPSVLGVERNAHFEDIEMAYKRLRSKHHPDRGGNVDQFDRIQRAYDDWQANQ